jgi:peptidyl-prolyl cis-trans isomerase SurA
LRLTGTVALLMTACLAQAEVIDRIAVSVGNRVVTTSDVDREIRVVAFQQRLPAVFDAATRRTTADRMVEQKLIRRELESGSFPLPAPADVEPTEIEFRKQNFPSDDAFRQALAQAGITEQDFLDELLWQRTLLVFIDVRFRPGVQVSEQDIQDYFQRVVEPAATTAHPGEAVDLEDYRDRIEETLAGQRVDKLVDTWLREARQRTEVIFHPEAFQ